MEIVLEEYTWIITIMDLFNVVLVFIPWEIIWLEWVEAKVVNAFLSFKEQGLWFNLKYCQNTKVSLYLF